MIKSYHLRVLVWYNYCHQLSLQMFPGFISVLLGEKLWNIRKKQKTKHSDLSLMFQSLKAVIGRDEEIKLAYLENNWVRPNAVWNCHMYLLRKLFQILVRSALPCHIWKMSFDKYCVLILVSWLLRKIPISFLYILTNTSYINLIFSNLVVWTLISLCFSLHSLILCTLLNVLCAFKYLYFVKLLWNTYACFSFKLYFPCWFIRVLCKFQI